LLHELLISLFLFAYFPDMKISLPHPISTCRLHIGKHKLRTRNRIWRKYVAGNALSFTYMIEQSSTLYGSGHVRRIIEPAIRTRFRTSVDLSVQKVGGLVHVDPGSIDWDLKDNHVFIVSFLKATNWFSSRIVIFSGRIIFFSCIRLFSFPVF